MLNSNRVQEIAEADLERIAQDVIKVRALLINRKAEDLIPMLLDGLEDRNLVSALHLPMGMKG